MCQRSFVDCHGPTNFRPGLVARAKHIARTNAIAPIVAKRPSRPCHARPGHCMGLRIFRQRNNDRVVVLPWCLSSLRDRTEAA